MAMWRTNVYRVSLWVICVASHCVSCSQHLVIVFCESHWHRCCVEFKWQMSKTRLWRFKLESVAFMAMLRQR